MLVAKALRFKDLALDPILAEPVLRGYLAVTVELDTLGEQVSQSRIGRTGGLTVVDQRGRVLFDDRADRAGTVIREDVLAQYRQAAATGRSVEAVVEGEPGWFAARTAAPGLLVVARLPQADLLAASRELKDVVLVTVVLATLVTVLLILGFIRYFLLAPIQQLGNATREIGRGNFVPLEIARHDEFGELALAFNSMSRACAAPETSWSSTRRTWSGRSRRGPPSCRRPRMRRKRPAVPRASFWQE